nr:hypothetical protein [Tanacetum cinerariifolium]
HRLKTLEAIFSEFMQTNQFVETVSSISRIVDRYIDHEMNEAVKVAVQLQSDRLRDEAQAENEDFINKLDENIQKIIKEQVKRKSRNLYKALVDAYECDKIILDTYADTVTLKIRRDDEDKDEEPSAGSDRGSKRRRAGAAGNQPVAEASQHPEWFQKQTKPPTPDRAWNTTFPATHRRIQPWISDLAKQVDSRTSFNKLMDTPVDFLAFLMNRLKVDTLTPELLAGPTYELMKGS